MSFLTSLEHIPKHIVQWVGGEAPKAEELALRVETWIGANKTLSTYRDAIISTLERAVIDAGHAAITDMTKAATPITLNSIVAEVEKVVPTIIKNVEEHFIATAKANDPNTHSSIIYGAVNMLYTAIGPKIPAILGSIVAAALAGAL